LKEKKMAKREIRFQTTALKIEKRAEGEEEKFTLVGYAAVFNQRTKIGWFEEEILPGAFRESLERGADVVALIEHDMSKPIARTRDGGKTGSLKLREDEVGLAVEIEVVDTTEGRDLMKKIRAGIIDAMSFGFTLGKEGDSWYEDRDGNLVRELRNLNVFDVSPVTFPAYPQTEVSEKKGDSTPLEVRSLKEVYDNRPEGIEKRSTEGENDVSSTENDAKETENEPKNDEIRLIIREELAEFFKKTAPEVEEKSESAPETEPQKEENFEEKLKRRKRLKEKISIELESVSL